MTDFAETNWAKPEFSRQYRDNADIYIVERGRLLEIMKSYYRRFLLNSGKDRVLDLGCGDGILTHSLMEVNGALSATLIDPSEDMLNKARERLQTHKDVHYIRASFQELLKDNILRDGFDFIVSSLAIHHLTTEEKKALFSMVYSHLDPNGYFVNIDVVLAPTDGLEQWYMKLWQEWMDERKTALGLEKDLFNDIIKRYKELEENKPDTLDSQLTALKDIGFREVDCFYKYGVFAVFGGRKV